MLLLFQTQKDLETVSSFTVLSLPLLSLPTMLAPHFCLIYFLCVTFLSFLRLICLLVTAPKPAALLAWLLWVQVSPP